MLGTILLAVLILLLIMSLPGTGFTTFRWGYGPSSGLCVVILIVLILLLMGKI